MFSRSASLIQRFLQSCDTHASVHFLPSSMQEHSPGIHFLPYLRGISSKTWSNCKIKINMNQSSSISVRTGIVHPPYFLWHNIEYLFYNYNNNVSIVVMRHRRHKQPSSIICNTKYIMGKSSTATLLLVYNQEFIQAILISGTKNWYNWVLKLNLHTYFCFFIFVLDELPSYCNSFGAAF